MKIKIFPHSTHKEIIHLPKDEVKKKLLDFIQIKPSLFNRKEGLATNTYGRVYLKSNHRNNFTAEIKIIIEPIDESSSKLIFKFGLAPIVKTGLLVWSILILSISFIHGFASIEDVLEPLGFIAVAIILMFLGFSMSLEHSITHLKKVVKKIKNF